MTIRAVFFDLGGVLVRTEFQAPRELLAQRLGLSYEQLVNLVFEGESSRQASVGAIGTEEHWQAVTRTLGLPPSETEAVRRDFFAGDVVDHDLIAYIRSLRPKYHTGLISNAWPDLRGYIIKQGFDDAFDAMIISAEVGVMKPDPRIYQIALERVEAAPEEAIFMDDMAKNIQGAQAIGMVGIRFGERGKALEELRQLLVNHC